MSPPAVFSGRTRRLRPTAAGLGLLSLLALAVFPARASAVNATTPVYNVVAYGAKGNGVTDATAAFASAIAAAEANGGGTVYVPAGIYAFTKPSRSFGASIQVHGTVPVTLAGAGDDTTSLVEHVPGQPLVSIQADGSTVEGLTLDTKSFGGGTVVGVSANDTLLQQARVLGSDRAFALFYTGPPGATPSAPSYNVGNSVSDIYLTDDVTKDGFSFSYQKDASISDVTHEGSRLSLYVDDQVTVTDYAYTPGLQSGGTNGFWITPPSNDITITGFLTAGAGGVIGSPDNAESSSSIAIDDEQFTSPGGFHLEVGNVDGLTISGGSFNTANDLVFNPSMSATGVDVENTTLPGIEFSQSESATVNVTMNDDSFTPFVLDGKPAPTFRNFDGGATDVTIQQGSWSNQAGRFFRGTNTTFSITGLAGYP